jgi:tetratricopeptide (TPR) repeat protein
MTDYDNDIYSEPDYSRYKDDREARKSNSSILLIFIIALLSLVIIFLAYLYFFNKSDYEAGLEYLGRRQYDEALTEFQKVPPTNSDFSRAQSKIDYINGVRLFSQNDYPKAKIYLEKVSPSDEFYNEVRLMMDRIKSVEKEEELKHQLAEDEQKKILEAQKETEQKIKDNDESKKYLSSLTRLEEKFESEYQLAKVENSVAMKKNLRTLTAIRQEMIDLTYNASAPDPAITSYKNLMNQWMNSRINLIQKAIMENVITLGDVTPETAAIEEEGNKLKEKLASEKEKVKELFNISE